jgi:signal recognition particle receptor subunit beta
MSAPNPSPSLPELRLKFVYAGPGLSGKTTNLASLYRSIPGDRRGKLVTVSTGDERTLFFDFLPVDVGQVAGFRLRLSLYTVPGQHRYRVNQALILRDADGIVFVADSIPVRMEANRAALATARTVLADQARPLETLPVVFQYNKRDVPNRTPIDVLEEELNAAGAPFVPAIAREDRGVAETLKEITRQAVRRNLLGGGRAEGRAPLRS